MTDQERTQLVETALKGIKQVQECTENALTADGHANGDSRRRAANVMLFVIMTAPVFEKIAQACHDIADKDGADLDTESPTPTA